MIPRYSREEMTSLWTDQARFELWLEVETVAMEAMVAEGLVPASALKSVKEKGGFNVERILEIEAEVKHDVIAFLTNVAEHVGEDARFLHYGMTSSDLLDTSFSIQLTRATDLILKDVDQLLSAVKIRAVENKTVVCIGRSHGIHAEPTTFGLKLLTYYAELKRQKQRIEAAREGIAVGAVSGPVGTFPYLKPSIESAVCEKLGLKPDPISTQIINRDRHAALFSAFAQLGGTIERLAVEVRHLQRTEVREAEENFTRGQKGSSSMPHKRNPVLSENVTGLARLLRSWSLAALENVALWHERDISHSSVERVIAPDMTVTLDFMLARAMSIVSGLVVYPENMKRNLESTHGLVFSGGLLVALAKNGISREAAYKLVQTHAMAVWDELSASPDASGIVDFPTRVRADKNITSLLPAEELESVFSLEHHLAHVDELFERVLAE